MSVGTVPIYRHDPNGVDCGQEISVEPGSIFCNANGIGSPQWDANPIETCPKCERALTLDDMTWVRNHG